MAQNELKKIIEAAQAGGKVLKKYFGSRLATNQKSTAADVYTKADIESEAAILNIVEKAFPEYNVQSEEIGTKDKKSESTFIIDPLDSTSNFLLGIPFFSVSIGLMREKRTICGVVHNPMIDYTYYAEHGRGAFLDGKRIAVNSESDIKKSVAVGNQGWHGDPKFFERIRRELRDLKIKRFLSTWSPALNFCLLASGKIEAVVNGNRDIHDFAAGKLIAREAGAMITDFEGATDRDDQNWMFLATNGTALHQKLLTIVSSQQRSYVKL